MWKEAATDKIVPAIRAGENASRAVNLTNASELAARSYQFTTTALGTNGAPVSFDKIATQPFVQAGPLTAAALQKETPMRRLIPSLLFASVTMLAATQPAAAQARYCLQGRAYGIPGDCQYQSY